MWSANASSRTSSAGRRELCILNFSRDLCSIHFSVVCVCAHVLLEDLSRRLQTQIESTRQFSEDSRLEMQAFVVLSAIPSPICNCLRSLLHRPHRPWSMSINLRDVHSTIDPSPFKANDLKPPPSPLKKKKSPTGGIFSIVGVGVCLLFASGTRSP